MTMKLGRRSFLSSLGAVGAAVFGSSKLGALTPAQTHTGGMSGRTGSLSSPGLPLVDGHPITTITTGFCSTSNPWAELGIIPMVNNGGTYTVIGGSTMRPEVMEAIRIGNMHFVVMDDLYVKAGKFITDLCKSPAGYNAIVTEGDAAGLMVMYSGMMTEDYNQRMLNIPDVAGFPRTEVIIQAGHRDNFDHQIRQTGAKLVVVNSKEEMLAAINPRTFAMHYNHIQSDRSPVSGEEMIAIAKQHGIYVLCDASADLPPKERLWELPAMGYDAVVFSGGKDLCGPAATGMVIAKENLCKWAVLNMSPQENRIGRVCKVGKESLFGFLKALEMFVHLDYNEQLKKYDARAKVITDALAPYGVTANARQFYIDEGKPVPLGNVSPRYSWTWDADKIKLTSQEITKKLSETLPVAIGNPPSGGMGAGGMSGRPDPNWTGPNDYNIPRQAPRQGGRQGGGRGGAGGPTNTYGMQVWLLKDGEDKYIANRLVEIFKEAGAKPMSRMKASTRKS